MTEKGKLRQDWFLSEDRRLWQHPDHFRFNTDTALLARFMEIRPGDRVVDIGTNNGVLLLYADEYGPGCMTGIELLHEPAQLAKKNLAGCHSPWTVLESPVQEVTKLKADVVLSNPPYFSLAATDSRTPLTLRQQGRAEFHLTLRELCASAARFLDDGGRFYLVHRPDRLQEILTELQTCRLAAKRLQLVYDRRDGLCKSLLVEARKNGSPGGLRIMEPGWIGQERQAEPDLNTFKPETKL